MKTPWLCALVVLGSAAASPHAQEGAVRQVTTNTVNWSSFGTRMDGMDASNTLVMEKLDSLKACAAQSMFYAPANNPRADGCK